MEILTGKLHSITYIFFIRQSGLFSYLFGYFFLLSTHLSWGVWKSNLGKPVGGIVFIIGCRGKVKRPLLHPDTHNSKKWKMVVSLLRFLSEISSIWRGFVDTWSHRDNMAPNWNGCGWLRASRKHNRCGWMVQYLRQRLEKKKVFHLRLFRPVKKLCLSLWNKGIKTSNHIHLLLSFYPSFMRQSFWSYPISNKCWKKRESECLHPHWYYSNRFGTRPYTET